MDTNFRGQESWIGLHVKYLAIIFTTGTWPCSNNTGDFAPSRSWVPKLNPIQNFSFITILMLNLCNAF